MIQWIDKKTEVRKMSETEKAWLAGVIDGEGSIGLYDYGREGRRVCVQIGNTNEAFVLRVKEIIGCGSNINRNPYHQTHYGGKMMYVYSLKGSNRCYWVLKQIKDYLIIKKKKAKDIINELESKPFGRWASATPEYRKINSNRLKKEWQNPTIRKNRIEGMKKYYADRRKEK